MLTMMMMMMTMIIIFFIIIIIYYRYYYYCILIPGIRAGAGPKPSTLRKMVVRTLPRDPSG